GRLVGRWAGGQAVVEGRLSLGALAAFNGYLAFLTLPTIALGWTLSIVRRRLTSMQRIQEITGARAETVVAGTASPDSTAGGRTEERSGSAALSPIYLSSDPSSPHAP